MRTFLFTSITVSLEAEDAFAAYDRLCEILGKHDIEFSTDWYHEYNENGGREEASEPTWKLFPSQRGEGAV
jgi:hypothetical protein